MNVEARIRAAFEGIRDDGTPYRHANAPIHIVEVRGRCVHAKLSGTPDWTDLAVDLLGDGHPCSEFRLDGRSLYARVKTDEQLLADGAAIDIDEKDGELSGDSRTHGWPCLSAPAPKEKRERDSRGKWEKALEKFIRASGGTTFRRIPMLEDAREAFETAGNPIRLDNLNREFKKLIGRVVEEIEDGDPGEDFRLKSEK